MLSVGVLVKSNMIEYFRIIITLMMIKI